MIGAYIILILIIIFFIHSVIPTYYNKYFNTSCIRKTDKENEVMLTFDDGPDSRYIYRLLELLDDFDIKAIFFVVGKNAEKNRGIITDIIKNGHKIGFHSWEHKNAMLYSYNYTKKDFKNTERVRNKLNINKFYYRPPWGHTNIFSMFFARKYKAEVIYWDVMAEDWKIESNAKTICDKLLRRTKNKSIICLHDAGENSGGDKGATENTIEGLRLAIPKLKEKGYRFILPD
ncbi:polysaccharide deacetylase family protein [Peptostreptococcus canis]|uniref:Polysaccharide deacetylase family protein n=1 Tax=Peptostreptococcus canis TaxID=1159213 RepID=A0ABR6TJ72_9FIRM|nr:polysaccharide deacetylase family protein [Peptostreptococcus canis]MBC2575442.1 polysaccharide deacetylase family protein [Peptostreptococcus canis]MBP1997366.1 peptidoglycan/xylan/chitin deacetylase (PgdA/CDA1 family) [Peptostreptococcus canis]